MKKLTFILIVFAALSCYTVAQTNQGGRIEAEKIAYFSRRLDLTPDEAKEFWPVYNDFVSRRDKINREKNALMRYINQNSSNLSDKELEDAGDKIVDLGIKEAELARTYHSKFKTILPPLKVVRIYQTEMQFKRILLDQLKNKRSQQMPGRRQGQF